MNTDHLAENVGKLATQIAQGLAYDPKTDVTPSNVPATAEALKPMILHATNNEPWYQSRVTWGAILSLVSAVLGIFGYVIEPELTTKLLDGIVAVGVAIGLIAGPLTTLYGRYIARKPIGS